MKCPHCKEDLGNGDAYDLMEAHRWSCHSKVGKKISDALENKFNGIGEDE